MTGYQPIVIPFNYPGKLAEDGGVEPHPISENLVFKASRRTNPAASSSIIFGTPARIRTGIHNTPFERAAFTNLATGALSGVAGQI
jgi:hypothetical protein